MKTFFGVIRLGLEPRTPSLKGMCSTCWASESMHRLSPRCGGKCRPFSISHKRRRTVQTAFCDVPKGHPRPLPMLFLVPKDTIHRVIASLFSQKHAPRRMTAFLSKKEGTIHRVTAPLFPQKHAPRRMTAFLSKKEARSTAWQPLFSSKSAIIWFILYLFWYIIGSLSIHSLFQNMMLLASMQVSYFEISIRMMVLLISYLEIWYYPICAWYCISKYRPRWASSSYASKNTLQYEAWYYIEFQDEIAIECRIITYFKICS